jgi:TPR repeat protein
MMRAFTATLALIFVFGFAPQADAAKIRYYEDPPYKALAPEDPHPMEDLVALAEQGEARAQFILGDLYGKGKGGLGKNQVKARYWFETSARNGYTASFMRLAAMAKRQQDYVSAYKWYTLEADHGSSRERKWANSQRDMMVKDKKIDRAGIREAKDAVSDWMKKRDKALAEDRARAKVARDEAKRNEDTEKLTGKTPPAPVKEEPKYKYIKKEKAYND